MKQTAHRFQLRELTRPHHEELDAEVGTLDSQASYRRYLTGIAFFRSGVEPNLRSADYPTSFGSWRPALVQEQLDSDLRDLGIFEGPKQSAMVLPHSISGLLGMLYVLEGSSLGARLLARQAAALGYDGTFGARHLAEQTSDPRSWANFQSILESVPGFDIDAAADAAAATFARARDAFRQVRHAEA